MKTGFNPLSGAMMEHARRYQHAAWFALGCLEREHLLNLNALMRYWARPPMGWWALPAATRHAQPGARSGTA